MKYKFGDVVKDIKVNINREDNPYPYYIAGDHMDSEDLHIHRKGSFETDAVGPAFIREFKKGQVLYGSRRTYLKKVAVADFDGITSNTTFVFETKDQDILLQELIPFIILSERFTQWSINKSRGSTNPYVLFEDLAEYTIDLPDLDKQKELAEVLWAIDDTICKYKILLDQTDELVKSQFIEMFGDPTDSGLTRIPLGEYVENTKYGTSQPPQYDENGCFKFIRATNIKNGHITEEDMRYISKEEADKIGKCRLTSGELIIVRSGVNTGDTCVVTNEYNGQYAGYDIIVTLKTDKLNPVFLNELINAPEYMKTVVKPLTARSAQPHLNTQQVQGLPILVVDIDKQNEFADFSEQSDKSKFELKRALAELEALSKTIVEEYLG